MRLKVCLVSAVIFSGLTGCSVQASDSPSFALVEFSIEGPARMSSEAASVSVANAGKFPHTLVVTDSEGQVVAATPLILPGESTELALEPQDGTYSFTCRIVAQGSDGEIVDHFEAGMNTTVSIEGH